MKSFFAAVILVLLSAQVQAGWRYEPYDGTYFTRFSESGAADSYYWYRDGHGHWCRSNYPVYTAKAQSKIQYGKNWKERLVDQLGVKSDNEQFRSAIAESGLASQEQSQTASTSQYGSAYGQQGLSISTYGAAATGNTLYGVNASPLVPQIDWQSVQNFQERFQNRAFDAAQVSNTGFMTAVNSANAANTENERLRITSQALIAAQSTVPPRTEIRATGSPFVTPQADPQQQSQTSYEYESRSSTSNVGPPGNGFGVGNGGEVLRGIIGGVIVKNNCAQCHNGRADSKSTLDLTSIDRPKRRGLTEEASKRLWSADPDKVMPPKSHGELDAEDRGNVIAWFRS